MSSELISLDAEQAVLGSVMYDPDAARDAIIRLDSRHFVEPIHQAMWEAVKSLSTQGKKADLVTVGSLVESMDGFIQLGGWSYLDDLVDKGNTWALSQHIDILLDRSTRRDLVQVAQTILHSASDLGSDAFSHVVGAERALGAVMRSSVPDTVNFINARASGHKTLESMKAEMAVGRHKGQQTGLSCFDRRLGGLSPEILITIGGRPSMGKSALMRGAMYGAAKLNPDSLFAIFSAEMGDREISERALAAETAFSEFDTVTTEAISQNAVTALDIRRLNEVVDHLPENLIIDDRADISVDDVRKAVWALKRMGDLKAIAIDYLQIMRKPDLGRGSTDAARIGEMTQSLKRLAREAGICIILLSQLSRDLEKREDKRPILADLRDSGSIEQDSNVVVFPFREVYYLERSEPKKTAKEYGDWEIRMEDCRRRMDVIIAKNRQGGIGVERQVYDPQYDHIQNERGR